MARGFIMPSSLDVPLPGTPHAMHLPQAQEFKLLGKIDALRAAGVDILVELPQLIIFGNRSTEKSAVLEAISHVHFPDMYSVGEILVTEIILRQSPQLRIDVSIEPRQSRERLAARQEPRQTHHWSSSKDCDLPALLQQAAKRIGSSEAGISRTNLRNGVLRIKISGPKTPNLTLVDLAELDFQARKNELLSEMTRKHLKNTRSLFLAVLDVESEGNLEGVLNTAKTWDPKLERVFVILYQPQKLAVGSHEEAYREFVNNDTLKLQLGWHVLCDRSLESYNIPQSTRDEHNQDLFKQEPWASLPREAVGVDPLRRRLGSMLTEHVRRCMSSVEADIQGVITEDEKEIKALGPERGSLHAQRGFLLDISNKLQLLTEQALSGVYTDEFFGAYGDHTNNTLKFRRLRAIIRELNESFAEAMNIRGCRRIIQDPECPTSSMQTSRFNPYMAGWVPQYVNFVELQNEVNEQARNSGGTELPGAVNHFLVGSLFRDQAKPWKDLAEAHLRNAWEAANYFVCQAIHYLTDDRTYSRLVEAFVHPEMERLKETLLVKLNELASSIERRHLLPVGKAYLSKIRKSQQERQLALLKSNLGLSSNPSASQPPTETERSFKCSDLERAMDQLPSSKGQLEASEAIDQMQECYDSAMLTFVDNVAMLAIENCLLRPLEHIFTSRIVNDLSEERTQYLAAEQPGDAENRERLNEELDTLRKAKSDLNSLGLDCISPPPPPIFSSQLSTQTGFSNYGQFPSLFQTSSTNQGAQRELTGNAPGLLFETPFRPPVVGGSTEPFTPALCGPTAQPSVFGIPANGSLFGTTTNIFAPGTIVKPETPAQPLSPWGVPRSSSDPPQSFSSLFGGASVSKNPTSTASKGDNSVAVPEKKKQHPPRSSG